MKNALIPFLAAAALLFSISARSVQAEDATGFDEFGYNYQAQIFVGTADGVDRIWDGKVNGGNETLANDHVVKKWNAEWDRGVAENWADPNGYDAWEDNEWNGAFAGGSGEVWHYKIKWVGPLLQASPRWAAGGYVWHQDGQEDKFEVIMDQGVTADGKHKWMTHAKPNGYGAK